ncbi:hypothetical protein ACP4OV_023788 [Aristida adscensionis]
MVRRRSPGVVEVNLGSDSVGSAEAEAEIDEAEMRRIEYSP